MKKLVLLSLVVVFISSQLSQVFNWDLDLQNHSRRQEEWKKLMNKQFQDMRIQNEIGEYISNYISFQVGFNRGSPQIKQFKKWMQKHSRTYKGEQQQFRYGVYSLNLKTINEHNADKTSLFKMEANKFADTTEREFKFLFLMNVEWVKDLQFSGRNVRMLQKISNDPKIKFDWRNNLNLSPPKDQGSCGSCYIFAAIGALQIHVAKKFKIKQPDFSQQFVIDCCKFPTYYCKGCQGGQPTQVMRFLGDNGIVDAKIYPNNINQLEASQCKRISNKNKKFYLNKNQPFRQHSNQKSALDYLTKSGPISVLIESKKMTFYHKGIYDRCPQQIQHDHAVLLIGVEEKSWILRNSWGSDWGQKGYIRVLKSKYTCGIFDFAINPVLV